MNMAFNHKKAIQAVNYFAQKEGGKIDKMKAIKLVWLSDRLHLRTYARMITNDRLYAMAYGPVPSQTLNYINDTHYPSLEIQEYRNRHIHLNGKKDVSSMNKVDNTLFSVSDLSIMEKVYSDYGKYSAMELSNMSHQFPEWERYCVELNSGHSTRELIVVDDLFKNIEKSVSFPTMNDNAEALFLSKELFFGVESES